MVTLRALTTVNMAVMGFESLTAESLESFGDPYVWSDSYGISYEYGNADEGNSSSYYGQFKYIYDDDGFLIDITGTVTQISYEWHYHDYFDEYEPGKFYSGGWSISVDIPVSEFQNAGSIADIFAGDDRLYGSSDNDTLYGFAGSDVIEGNGGNDIINGGTGADIMLGGTGNDIYYVDNVRDVVFEFENEGTDTVRSSISWTLSANVERLELLGSGHLNGTGNALANTLVGNGGNNILNGGAGADYMAGGKGNDVYYVDNVGDKTVESANGGTDTVRSTISWTLSADVERLELLGSGHLNGTGNALANTLVGNAGNNILNGGAGADYMAGGAGDDIYYVDSAGDSTVEAASGGTDTVRSTISWTLAANVERLELVGTAGIGGTGNALNNTIVGNGGNNLINGGAGKDYLVGGAGNDTFFFNTALGASNIDTIADYNVVQDTIRLENAIFTGLADGWLTAGAFHTGSAAADASDRIIYNKTTGALLFDKDGAGGAAAVHFATISPGLAMTANEFFIV